MGLPVPVKVGLVKTAIAAGPISLIVVIALMVGGRVSVEHETPETKSRVVAEWGEALEHPQEPMPSRGGAPLFIVLAGSFQRIVQVIGGGVGPGGTALVKVIGETLQIGEGTVTEPPIQEAQYRAFPEAEGFGWHATWNADSTDACNRDSTEVHFVTNTNATGSGSLEYAVETLSRDDTLDIIIFRTGGTIEQTGEIKPLKSCIYIAGQSAPGGGIQLRNPTTECSNSPFNAKSDHLIIRYMRFRPGIDSCTDIENEGKWIDALSWSDGSNVMFDHVSLQFSADELTNAWADPSGSHVSAGTYQYSIFSFPLRTAREHAMCWIMGNSGGASTDSVTVWRSLFAHCDQRSPRHKTGRLQFSNNIVYNWESVAAWSDAYLDSMDFRDNYYKAGADRDNSICEITITGSPKVYVDRVRGPNRPTDTGDDWDPIVGGFSSCPDDKSAAKATAPFDGPELARLSPFEMSESGMYEVVLDSVGATRKLNDSACNGTWLAALDALDDSTITQVRDSTGVIITGTADIGGWPTLAAGTPCTDSDSDGMPDVFEDLYAFLDKNDDTDAAEDNDGDGYTNIEEYLNGSPP